MTFRMYLNLKFFLAEGNPCESRIYIRYVGKIVDQVCQLDDLRAWVSFCCVVDQWLCVSHDFRQPRLRRWSHRKPVLRIRL